MMMLIVSEGVPDLDLSSMLAKGMDSSYDLLSCYNSKHNYSYSMYSHTTDKLNQKHKYSQLSSILVWLINNTPIS